MEGFDLTGMVCIVTGANAGIGKATTQALARRGATVVMACRDLDRGEAARAEISATGLPGQLEVLPIDLSSPKSVLGFVDAFRARHGRVDALVNNAAVYKATRELTPDGIETMFATNHLGPFLLTHLLRDALAAAGAARVITVTAPSTTRVDFENLDGAKGFNALRVFGATKMCNLLFTFELARQLQGTGVTANAAHPGIVKSSLMKEAPRPMQWMTRLVAKDPARAAESVADLATSPAFQSVSGALLRDGKPIEANSYARDPDVQRRLWDTSIALLHL